MILIALSNFINNDIANIIITATVFLLCPKNSTKTLHILSKFLSHDRKKKDCQSIPILQMKKEK